MCNKSKKAFKNKQDVEFGTGNVADLRLEVKKSLPEASRFTEKDQNKKFRQGGHQY